VEPRRERGRFEPTDPSVLAFQDARTLGLF